MTTTSSIRRKDTRVYQKMRVLGLAIWATGATRLHKDGDGFAAVFRPWHPVTWLVLVALVLPCALLGEQLTYVVPLRLPKFWREHLDQLQRVTPWTRLDSLKPFIVRLAPQPLDD